MKKVRCPSCREWATWEGNPYRPFCTEACRKKDLGNWALERYRIPGNILEAEEEKPGKKSEE